MKLGKKSDSTNTDVLENQFSLMYETTLTIDRDMQGEEQSLHGLS